VGGAGNDVFEKSPHHMPAGMGRSKNSAKTEPFRKGRLNKGEIGETMWVGLLEQKGTKPLKKP